MKFKVGDRVRRTALNYSWNDIFGEQTEGIVTYINGDDILIDNKNVNGENNTFSSLTWSVDAFELVEEDKTPFKAGDRVERINSNHVSTSFKIGDTAIILSSHDVMSNVKIEKSGIEIYVSNRNLKKVNTGGIITDNETLIKYCNNDINSLYSSLLENNVVTPQEGEMKMNKIVELYQSRRMSEINKNESMEIEKVKEKESPLRKKIMKLKEDTQKELNKLYMSQFTKEQIKEFETVGVLDTTGIELKKRFDITLGFEFDNGYKNEEIEKIAKQADVLRDELHTLIAEVNAMLSIIPENETDKIMSVLGKYGIITELGTLTI